MLLFTGLKIYVAPPIPSAMKKLHIPVCFPLFSVDKLFLLRLMLIILMSRKHFFSAWLGPCLLILTSYSWGAETATSTPCGYIQTDLYGKNTSYWGLGVHPEALMQHTIAEGNITVSGKKITLEDTDVNFTDLLMEDEAYELELHFGDDVISIPVNRDAWKKPSLSWTSHSVTVEDNMAADLVKKTAPDFYILRKARTINDILGGSNTFNLKPGSATSADSVNVFNSTTTKLAIYFSSTDGKWMRRGSKDDMGMLPVLNHEPLQSMRKAGSDLMAFVLGETTQKNQKILLPQKSSLLHIGLPVPQTLLSTSLHTALPNHGSDMVYISLDGTEDMIPCYYDSSAHAWKRSDTGEDVSAALIHGAINILSNSKIPAYITILSTILSNQPPL